MTTMATETRSFAVGDRVRGIHSGRVGTIHALNPDGRTCMTDWTERGRSGDLGRQARTALNALVLVEAAPESDPEAAPARQPGEFLPGDVVDSATYGRGTIVELPNDDRYAGRREHGDHAVKIDGNDTGGYFDNGIYTLPAGDLTMIEPVAPAQPAPITEGVRVRVASPASTTPDGRGYVAPAAYGQVGVVGRRSGGIEGCWLVTGGGWSQVIHENYLTVITPSSDESAAVDTDTDDGTARVGDVVRDDQYGGTNEGRVISRDTGAGGNYHYRGHPEARDYSGIVTVRFQHDDVQHYAGSLTLVRRDDSPIAEPEAGYHEAFPIGQHVWHNEHGVGVVVEKPGVGTAGGRASRQQIRSSQWSAVQFANGTTTFVQTNYLVLRNDGAADLGALSDTEKLDMLQRMIHRVASYEAQRRNWCGEVNTALRHLDGLLPTELQRVSRDLGDYLVSHPEEMFRLDTGPSVEIAASDSSDYDDDDDDHPVYDDRTFDLTLDNVSYDTRMGYSVTGATVYVRVTVEGGEYEVEDPSEWAYSDHVDDDLIRSAIDADDDLPSPDGYASFSFDDGDWTEV